MEFGKRAGAKTWSQQQFGAKAWSTGLIQRGMRVSEGFQAWARSPCSSHKHHGGETRETLGSRVLIRGN